jgi:hypothetical protein
MNSLPVKGGKKNDAQLSNETAQEMIYHLANHTAVVLLFFSLFDGHCMQTPGINQRPLIWNCLRNTPRCNEEKL